MKGLNKVLIGFIAIMALCCFAVASFAQNQDANPYGGIYYNDHQNYRMYGANGLPRTDHANLDTLTNVLKGDLRFDTLNSVVVVYDGTDWVDILSGSLWSNTGNYIYQTTLTDSVGIGTNTPTAKLDVTATSGVLNAESTTYSSTIINGAYTQKRSSGNLDFNYSGVIDDFNPAFVGFAGVLNSPSQGNLREVRVGFMDTINGKGFGLFSLDQFLGGFILQSDTNASGPNPIYCVGNRVGFGTSFGSPISAKIQVDAESLSDAALFQNGNVVVEDTLEVSGIIKYVDGNEADGYVLTSDADGNATWTHTFSYGEMGFGDSTATIALTQNTPAWVTNGNNDLWSEGAITLEGITYSNDSLICNADGIYEVNLRISGDLALNDVLKVGVYKNGSLSCTCQGQITSPLAGTVEITYVDILPLSADDVLQVYITNTANSNDFDAISAKMTMHKVGN